MSGSSSPSSSASHMFCLVCPTHHRQYDSGCFVLVPSKHLRELLIEHEHRNFAMREEILSSGGGDPGRTLPQVSTVGYIGFADFLTCCCLKLIDEFEYIPIYDGPFHAHSITRRHMIPACLLSITWNIGHPLYYISEHLMSLSWSRQNPTCQA